MSIEGFMLPSSLLPFSVYFYYFIIQFIFIFKIDPLHRKYFFSFYGASAHENFSDSDCTSLSSLNIAAHFWFPPILSREQDIQSSFEVIWRIYDDRHIPVLRSFSESADQESFLQHFKYTQSLPCVSILILTRSLTIASNLLDAERCTKGLSFLVRSSIWNWFICHSKTGINTSRLLLLIWMYNWKQSGINSLKDCKSVRLTKL